MPATTWKLVFEDDFNGPALDSTLWRAWYPAGTYRNANGYNSYMDNGQALSFANGTMRITGFAGPSGSPGCGGVVSATNYGPGYYEARVKAGASWSAFWVQGIGADCSQITDGFEADILETNPSWAATSQHAMHWGGYASCHQTASKNPLNLKISDFHVIGMDWSTTRGVTMYVDGVQSWSMPTATASNTGQIRFTIEGVCQPNNPLEVDYFCYYKQQ